MVRLILSFAILAALAGCGGGVVPGVECRCAAGITVACACPVGTVGTQACSADCSGWDPCQCVPAGTPLDLAVAVAPPDLAGAPPPDLTPPPTVFATIEVHGVTVGIAEANGDYWDGFGSVDSQAIADQAAALASPNPYQAAVAVIARNAAGATGPPDPYGTAMLFQRGAWGNTIDLAVAGSEQMNAYFANFPGPPGWQHVPIANDVRIHVHLQDEDSFGSEEIGTADIGFADVMRALATQGTYEAFVGNQTQNQLLFVGITVVAE